MSMRLTQAITAGITAVMRPRGIRTTGPTATIRTGPTDPIIADPITGEAIPDTVGLTTEDHRL